MRWLILALLLAGCAGTPEEGPGSVQAHMNGRAGFYTSVGGGGSR